MNLDLQNFDLGLVQHEVRKQELPEHEYLGIEVRLRSAARSWLERDLDNYDRVLLEEEFGTDPQDPGHGFLDLVLVKGTNCDIVDWKTTSGWDSPGWTLKKKLDPQTSWYLSYGLQHLRTLGLETKALWYRAVNQEGEVKEFPIAPSELHLRRVWQQRDALEATFQGLATTTGPWLQNMPEACFQYAKGSAPTCPFYTDCTTGSEPRLVQIQSNVLQWVPRSKSAYKQFLKCPEQYRRVRLLGDSHDDMGIEARIGIAFHYGAAEIWRQAFSKKETSNGISKNGTL